MLVSDMYLTLFSDHLRAAQRVTTQRGATYG